MTLPFAFKHIRLELARSKEFPEGSSHHGYEFAAPLDADSRIEPKLWRDYRNRCQVHRFWAGEEEKFGHLVHKPGGSEHAQWIFDYDQSRADDDETGYRFGAHRFIAGEYVTIKDQDEEHTFLVKSVRQIRWFFHRTSTAAPGRGLSGPNDGQYPAIDMTFRQT